MVMLQRSWRENGHVSEVVSLMENGCYKGNLFNGGGMVMLERWSVLKREKDHVREELTLMEGVVMLRRCPV